MTDCPHTPKYPDLSSIPSLQDALSHCSLVEGDPRVAKQRALTRGEGHSGETRIDAPYWQSLNDEQKAAIVAHERAHPQIGMDVECEGCADKVGGFLMRAWGFSPDTVRTSYRALNAARDPGHGQIAANAYVGAKAAERALASRGLLGRSSSVVASQIAADKLAQERARLASAAKSTESIEKVSSSPIEPVKDRQVVSRQPVASDGTSTIITTGIAESVAGSADVLNAPALAPTDNATTKAEGAFPLADAATQAGEPIADAGSDLAGDAVAFVLGEDARPHSRKVLIAAGAAAIIAVVLVALYRRK